MSWRRHCQDTSDWMTQELPEQRFVEVSHTWWTQGYDTDKILQIYDIEKELPGAEVYRGASHTTDGQVSSKVPKTLKQHLY